MLGREESCWSHNKTGKIGHHIASANRIRHKVYGQFKRVNIFRKEKRYVVQRSDKLMLHSNRFDRPRLANTEVVNILLII